MSATSKPITFQPSAKGQLSVQIDGELLDKEHVAREGYSLQESRFLKYLASKGHIGGTA